MDRNVIALNYFAGDPFETAYAVPQGSLSHYFFSLFFFFNFCSFDFFFPLIFFHPPFFVRVFFLCIVFYSGLFFYFFFSCLPLFHVPLSHLSPSTFAEAQLKQYWHKDFEESETQKDSLEDIR